MAVMCYIGGMNTIICIGCGDEVDEGEALNGYCEKCVDKFVKLRTVPAPMDPVKYGLLERVKNYLEVGGLFNPEMMDHDKVRDLIIDLRDYLEKH